MNDMKIGVIFTALLAYSCGVSATHTAFSEAQRLVAQIVAQHPTLMRLTIHAVPTGESENRIIACNIPEKLGQISDPEDLRVMTTKQAVVLREGGNLDVTMPIFNKAGKAIAAAGITFVDEKLGNEQARMQEARAIARQLAAGIQAMGKLPW